MPQYHTHTKKIELTLWPCFVMTFSNKMFIAYDTLSASKFSQDSMSYEVLFESYGMFPVSALYDHARVYSFRTDPTNITIIVSGCCKDIGLLDYCNFMLYCIIDSLFQRLQSVRNAATRLITQTGQRDHISPVLREQHCSTQCRLQAGHSDARSVPESNRMFIIRRPTPLKNFKNIYWQLSE